MDPARRQRIEDVCAEALDRTGDDRTAFVAAACGDDEALRQEVDALLVHATSGEMLLGVSIGVVAAQVLSEVRGGSLVGRQIGSYSVLSLLGAGGMGEVYRAHDARLARDVAIKVLPADPTPDRSRSRRFRREAQAIAGLNHPHICVVHDVGEQDGISYLVMEYLEGQTLKERLQDPLPLPLPDGLTIAIDVAGALVEAHRHGIVHRDVKPGNIMLTARGTKLLDFGLARSVAPIDPQSTRALTSAGMVLGTPPYMSPEQVRGQPVDPRSDVFSLGAVIYEMVTGRRPFDGANVIDTIDAVLHRDPRALLELRPEAPPALGSLVAKCLAKDKDERYQSVEQLWTDLLDVRQGTAPRGLVSRERDITELYASGEIRAVRPSAAPFTYVLPARGLVVGREAEIDSGFEEWTKDRSKPLLIWGPPGIGKSTLALSLLHHPQAARRFGARRFLIRCDGFTRTESVQTAMGSEWFGLAAGPRISGEVLAQLAAGPAAVVLDNFETPHRADAERSEEWLRRVAGIPNVWLIVALQGHEAPGGLDWARRLEPKRLTPDQSRTLFCRIAGVEPDPTDVLDRLLKDLDGVPHAIELMAHQAEADPDLSLLAERWSRQRTTLLRRGIGTTRQTNIAISYDFALASPAMSEGTLRMLRILASLPSGLADDDVPIAMEEVSGVTARDAASELKRCALAFAEAGRLRMLAPLREHILKAHPASVTELEPVRDRFMKMAVSAWEIGKTDGGGNTLALLTREHLNCRWAVETALEASDGAAVESAFWLGNFSRFSGGGTDFLERAVTLARQLGDRSGEAHCIERIGDIARVRSDHDAARRRYEEARSIYKALGDRRSEAICIKRAGDIALDRCEHPLAQQRYEEALGIFREIGVRFGEATCIHGLANIALRRLDNASARQRYQEAIAIYREVGALEGKASCFLGLGDISVFDHEYTDAGPLYEEALAIYREIGARFGEAHSIRSLGNVALALSDYTSAERRFEQARTIYRDVLDPQGEALCIDSLGDLASVRGDYELARQRYASALAIFRDVGDPHSEACCVLRLAENAVERRAYAEAATLFDEARVLFRQTEDRRGEANVVYGTGEIALRRGEYEDARRRLEQAQAMYRDIGERRGDAMCMLRLGDVAFATGNRDSARDWYEQALAGFRCVQYRPSIGESLLRLARLEEHPEKRSALIGELVELWRETDRQDLVDDLAREFPGDVHAAG